MAIQTEKLGALVVICCCFFQLSLVRAATRRANCTSFFFVVPTVASNDSGVLLPDATYNISAQHCPPTKVVPFRSEGTVQLLVHGGGGNKFIWSATGPVGSQQAYQPYNYSWVQFARAKGYHTVAIDRLGTGNSSHPDPEYVRVHVQVEILKRIVCKLRQGGVSRAVPRFDKVIGVGHSVGAILIGLMLPLYPKMLDAAILTGFTDVRYAFGKSISSLNLSQQVPARTAFPDRFGDLDPGYFAIDQESSVRQFYFAEDGAFDPAVASAVFTSGDVQASGEFKGLASMALDPNLETLYNASGTEFTGDVAVVTGAADVPFCAGDCGSGPRNYVRSTLIDYYSSTPGHLYAYEIPSTGHMLNFHYSTRKTYTLVHRWLRRIGY